MKIVISANSSWNIYNFRLPLILELKKKYHVIVVSPHDEYSVKLIKLGIQIEKINIDQSGKSFINDLKLIYNYFLILRKIKPNIYLGFTIKPNIYANIAGFFTKTKFINTITGLGTTFLNNSFLKIFTQFLYKISFYKSSLVVFQNLDDKKYFIDSGIIKNEKSIIINGSGVNISYFNFVKLQNTKNQKLNFLFAGRILWDKGINELIESIKLIKKDYSEVKFKVIGYIETQNITSVPINLLKKWIQEDLIEYIEPNDDIRKYIAHSDCIILPSYREGLSRILLEAASIGRPIICTDVPGCKDIVSHMENGLLCKPKNIQSLYKAIKIFINLDYDKRQKMSINSRKIIENKFEQKKINDVYIKYIKKLSNL